MTSLVRWLAVADVDPGWRSVLDDGERERLAAKSGPEEQARFVGAAALMRRVVGELAGCDPADVGLRRDCPDCDLPHGRPVPTGSAQGWHVSASHSGPHVLVAASARPVGVDVELVRSRPPSAALVARVVAPGEPEPADAEGFALLWAAKEAYLKALGTGLALPMSSVQVAEDRAVLLDGSAPQGRLERLDAPTGAVAWVCLT